MTEYKVPDWCKMPFLYHNDGMGGCWGISYSYVATEGEDYCKTCDYYEGLYKRINRKERGEKKRACPIL